MHALWSTVKASIHAFFAFNSLTSDYFFHCIQLLGYTFWLHLSNKLSNIKIASVLNYTKLTTIQSP